MSIIWYSTDMAFILVHSIPPLQYLVNLEIFGQNNQFLAKKFISQFFYQFSLCCKLKWTLLKIQSVCDSLLSVNNEINFEMKWNEINFAAKQDLGTGLHKHIRDYVERGKGMTKFADSLCDDRQTLALWKVSVQYSNKYRVSHISWNPKQIM